MLYYGSVQRFQVLLLLRSFCVDAVNKVHSRLSLFQRLSIIVGAAFLTLLGAFALVSINVVNEATGRLAEERLVMASLIAQNVDAQIELAFNELEKATNFASFDPNSPELSTEKHLLAHTYGQVGFFSSGISFLNADGKIIWIEPYSSDLIGFDLSAHRYIKDALEKGQRNVSAPFPDPRTGEGRIALTVPVKDRAGKVISLISGTT